MLNKARILLKNLKTNLKIKTNKASLKVSKAVDVADELSNSIYRLLFKTLKIGFLASLALYFAINFSSKLLSSDPDDYVSLNMKLLDQKYTGIVKENDPMLHDAVVKLVYKDSNGKEAGACSGFVISEYYVLTAGHCVATEFGTLDTNRLEIYNTNDQLITTAKVAGYISRSDVGIIRGNFKDFNQLGVLNSKNFTRRASGQFIACGFPQASKKIFCDEFAFKGISGFDVVGGSIFIPGMSGGPILDVQTGEVIGVISSSFPNTGSNAIASLLIGFDAALKIEE